jgi:glycosyltransferase involved in cell wall biosynthesis
MKVDTNNHSFAVLAYKESQYLELCIKSLLDQTAKENIYISTSTPSVFIDKMASKYGVPVYINHSGGSIGNDWNFALSKATTQYVTLAHQDDLYFCNYAKEVMKVTQKKDDAIIIFCDYFEQIDDKYVTNNVLLFVKRFLLLPFYVNRSGIKVALIKRLLLCLGSPICCPSVTYNKAVIKNFSFDNTFKINLDWDAWIRLSKMNGRFVFIPKKLMAHRIHLEAETTSGIKNDTRKNEDLLLFKRLWGKAIGRLISFFYSISYKLNSKV